jgi:hypothetical protein
LLATSPVQETADGSSGTKTRVPTLIAPRCIPCRSPIILPHGRGPHGLTTPPLGPGGSDGAGLVARRLKRLQTSAWPTDVVVGKLALGDRRLADEGAIPGHGNAPRLEEVLAGRPHDA